jgi:hypothetical protein
MTTTCDQLWSEAPKGAWKTSAKNKTVDAAAATTTTPTPSDVTERVCASLLTPLRDALSALDPRTAATIGPAAASAAMQSLLSRVKREGKGGVRFSAGGAARLRLDVETMIRAADVDGVAAAAEDAGVSVAAKTASAARKKRAQSGRFGFGGGGDWTSDACAGAGATALSAWRSTERRARAVARVAEACGEGKGGKDEGDAGRGLSDVEEWRRVCVA